MSALAPLTSHQPASRTGFWLVLSLLAAALNFRPALSSMGVELDIVQRSLSFSPLMAGILTMAPMICFGLSGLCALRVARYRGMESAIQVSLLLIAAGLLVRGYPSLPFMLLGTIMSGLGIGLASVLAPALIKRNHAHNLGLVTGLYTTTLCAGGALGALFTVMFSSHWHFSWNMSLALWSVPALLAAIMWRFQPRTVVLQQPSTSLLTSIWRSSLAWAVTIFMAAQASMAFITLGWLPVILQEKGLASHELGWILFIAIFVQCPSALLIPVWATRLRRQRIMAVIAISLTCTGYYALVAGHIQNAVIWAVVLGVGQGAAFGLALALIGLRGHDAGAVARLSMMSQSIGYLLAAIGPLTAGAIRQWSINPLWQVVLFTMIGLLAGIAGWIAGKPKVI